MCDTKRDPRWALVREFRFMRVVIVGVAFVDNFTYDYVTGPKTVNEEHVQIETLAIKTEIAKFSIYYEIFDQSTCNQYLSYTDESTLLFLLSIFFQSGKLR